MKRVISSESAVYGTEICFKRQKMIDGEYDLGKLLGIDFLNKDAIPDRGFLKEVTFTKNIYLGLNKVFQSFYRIQKTGTTCCRCR